MKNRLESDEVFPWMVEDADGLTLYLVTQCDGVDTRYMGVDGKFLKFQLAAPEGSTSAANRLLCECLAQLLRVEVASVEVVGGSHTRKKTIRIPGLRARTLRLRLGL